MFRQARSASLAGLSNILGESEAFTIGSNRDDVMFNKAYIMNEQGRTVETV